MQRKSEIIVLKFHSIFLENNSLFPFLCKNPRIVVAAADSQIIYLWSTKSASEMMKKLFQDDVLLNSTQSSASEMSSEVRN